MSTPKSPFKFSRWKFKLSIAVWLFPVFALILSGWIFAEYWKGRGALVEIRFPDAANIEEQKTLVKYRGITVGRAEKVELSADGRQVVVQVRMARTARQLVVDGTSFQVIEPQVGLQGISGLDTIFKGVYIDLTPGKTGNEEKNEFIGRQSSGNPFEYGVTYVLRSKFVDSIGEGDPVIFRGLKIGQVANVRLDTQARFVETRIRVQKRFTKLIRDNTAFWIKHAVQADVGLFGAKLELASMESLMKGGIQLATPNEAGKIANADSRFDLSEGEPKGWREWTPNLGGTQSVAGAQ